MGGSHYPGPGVGGHCIPKDPFYLLYKARKMGVNIEFIEEAAGVNRNMPLYVVHLAEETLKLRGKSLQNSSFGVLSIAGLFIAGLLVLTRVQEGKE